jgi:hypothetical protein
VVVVAVLVQLGHALRAVLLRSTVHGLQDMVVCCLLAAQNHLRWHAKCRSTCSLGQQDLQQPVSEYWPALSCHLGTLMIVADNQPMIPVVLCVTINQRRHVKALIHVQQTFQAAAQPWPRPPQLDFLSLVVWPLEEPMRAGGHQTTKFAGFCYMSHRHYAGHSPICMQY